MIDASLEPDQEPCRQRQRCLKERGYRPEHVSIENGTILNRWLEPKWLRKMIPNNGRNPAHHLVCRNPIDWFVRLLPPIAGEPNTNNLAKNSVLWPDQKINHMQANRTNSMSVVFLCCFCSCFCAIFTPSSSLKSSGASSWREERRKGKRRMFLTYITSNLQHCI